MFKHPVEPLRWSEITFDLRDHWVHLPWPCAYPLVVSPVVSQVRLANVLVDGGSALDIIFTSTLESMGYDMTSLAPFDQAFYGIIPRAGSTPVGRATLPVTFGTRDNYHTEYVNFEVAEFETSYHAILGRPRTSSSPTPWNDPRTRFLLPRQQRTSRRTSSRSLPRS